MTARKMKFYRLVLGMVLPLSAFAESGFLDIHVSDINKRPLAGIRLAPRGPGGVSDPTDQAGRTRIALPAKTGPGDAILLDILNPSGRFVMIFPPDHLVRVPLSDNKVDNFVEVVLVAPGDGAVLQDGSAISSKVPRTAP
jgi:hypothetical protein